MKNIKERVLTLANHIIITNDTIRQIAYKYNISKSTVHKDLSDRLKTYDKNKYILVSQILKNHDEIKHIRGGLSTKQKYENLLNL